MTDNPKFECVYVADGSGEEPKQFLWCEACGKLCGSVSDAHAHVDAHRLAAGKQAETATVRPGEN